MFDPALPLAIDYDLWLRVARHFEFDYVDEPLVRYRTGHANLSSRITERLSAVLAILRRSLVRRRNCRDGRRRRPRPRRGARPAGRWASCCAKREPMKAAGWYVRAAKHDRPVGADA